MRHEEHDQNLERLVQPIREYCKCHDLPAIIGVGTSADGWFRYAYIDDRRRQPCPGPVRFLLEEYRRLKVLAAQFKEQR